jgi:hypothetical protein
VSSAQGVSTFLCVEQIREGTFGTHGRAFSSTWDTITSFAAFAPPKGQPERRRASATGCKTTIASDQKQTYGNMQDLIFGVISEPEEPTERDSQLNFREFFLFY